MFTIPRPQQRVAALLFAGAVTGSALAGDHFSFPSDHTTLLEGRAQVIAFSADPGPARREPAWSVEPKEAVEMLDPPTILDGETVGFLRVRPHENATLKVGDSTLRLEVQPASPPEPTLKIVSPAEESCAWGRILVGAELTEPPGTAKYADVRLRLPSGEDVAPVSVQQSGATRTFGFQVDLTSADAGEFEVQPVARTPAGRELNGEPARLTVEKPDASQIISGVCAEHNADQRPERFKKKSPKFASSPGAPVAKFIDNSSPYPAWCLNVDIPEAGYYQMILEARGTYASGAYPSVGLFVGEDDRPKTISRIADSDWGRTPLGRPVYLSAGSHVLTPFFMNDFAMMGMDRNLFLARYELLRVDPAGHPDTTAAAPAMMMQSAAPQMMTGNPAMMMSASKPANTPEDGTPLDATDARVAFNDVFDGDVIAGPVSIRARAWTPNLRDNPPRVALRINGRTVQTQQGADLKFDLPSNAFMQGDNTVELLCESRGGHAVKSATQTLRMPVPTPAGVPPPQSLRFTAQDDRWDAASRERLVEASGWTLQFASNAESILTLPENLAGRFHVRLEARGDAFKGPAIAEIAARSSGRAETILSRKEISGWRTLDVGDVELSPGTNQLVVRFTNDLYEEKNDAAGKPGGDRNLFVKSVTLDEIRDDAPPAGPILHVAYPAAGAKVGSADAVVVDYFSGAPCQGIDLVIDGNPQHLDARPENGIGRVVLPLLTRSFSPGRHIIKVVSQDARKRKCESPEIPVEIVPPAVAARQPYARAIHLLNRLAYGPEPRQLAKILTEGEDAWLHDQLFESASSPAMLATGDAVGVSFPNSSDYGVTVPRVLLETLRTTNPVRARAVLWTENHFSTWIQKAEARRQWAQHQEFDRAGPGRFADLLQVSATSPAMLVYLDQNLSFADRLNENYAREIMELHTVGVNGGYSQADVTGLAKLLNGWTLAEVADVSGLDSQVEGEFRYEPNLNDGRARRIFGMEFPATAPDDRYDSVLKALEMLAAHPSTARFISRKLAEHYISVPAPDSVVDDLSRVFFESGGDLREMIVAISKHPAFWSAPDKVATPQDFGLRFARVLGATNAGAVRDFLNRSGMGLYERPSPDGYPEADSNYVNSNILMQRWRFSDAFRGELNRIVSPSWRPKPNEDISRVEAQKLVDFIAVRLTGRMLGDASNTAALDYFEGARQRKPDDVQLLTSFIAQTPELSLR